MKALSGMPLMGPADFNDFNDFNDSNPAGRVFSSAGIPAGRVPEVGPALPKRAKRPDAQL